MLTFGVQGGGSLIKQEDLGLSDQGPRNGDPLLLTSRELDTSLPHQSVKSLGEKSLVLDKSERVRHLAGLLNLPYGNIAMLKAIADVLLDAPREERRLLRHNGDLALEPHGIKSLDFLATEKDLAIVRVVVPLDERDDARLSAA
mmetsp:Transcript_12195/g.20555  ORF Transcript_12195/g.20555 Transcript_12195/m.20555 type:complete len:144 (-) Transcript_12195:1280-1711(-)